MVHIAGAMGHSTIATQQRYSHIIRDAHLRPLVSMADAIREARESVESSLLHSRCTRPDSGRARSSRIERQTA
jgi:hypothetical protein